MKRARRVMTLLVVCVIGFCAGLAIAGGKPPGNRRTIVYEILRDEKPAVLIQLCPEEPRPNESCDLVVTTNAVKLGTVVAKRHAEWLGKKKGARR